MATGPASKPHSDFGPELMGAGSVGNRPAAQPQEECLSRPEKAEPSRTAGGGAARSRC
jgi:hypothetical protein